MFIYIGIRTQQETGVSDQQYTTTGVLHCRTVQESLAGGTVLQVDQAAFVHQIVLRRV